MPGWCDGDCDGVVPDQLLVHIGERWLCSACWRKAGKPWPRQAHYAPQARRGR